MLDLLFDLLITVGAEGIASSRKRRYSGPKDARRFFIKFTSISAFCGVVAVGGFLLYFKQIESYLPKDEPAASRFIP
jgi:hypothetical protein